VFLVEAGFSLALCHQQLRRAQGKLCGFSSGLMARGSQARQIELPFPRRQNHGVVEKPQGWNASLALLPLPLWTHGKAGIGDDVVALNFSSACADPGGARCR
jgi:hypothetical protein